MSDFSVNERVYSIGLDMSCRKVVAVGRIVSFQPRDQHGRDCVVLTSSGFKMLDDSRTLFKSRADVLAKISLENS